MSKRKNLQAELVERALGRGQEPSWKDAETRTPTVVELSKVLNFYNANHDEKDKRKWVMAWAKKNRPDLVEVFDDTPLWCFGTYAVLIRLRSRGLKIGEANEIAIQEWIANVQQIVRNKAELAEAAAAEAPKRIKKNVGVDANLKAMDDALDAALSGQKAVPEFSATAPVDKVLEYCNKELETIKEEPLAYPKHMKAWFRSIVERLAAVKTAVKTRRVVTRKPRKVDPVKATRNVKYCRRDEDLKINSVDVSKMVGAQKVYLYHGRWKHIIKVVADSPAGLSFKGQQLVGVDLNKSTGRLVRKPNEVVKDKMGIRELDRTFGLLKGKEKTFDKIRMHETMVILYAG